MVERRAGGETGITAVQCLEGDAVWAALDSELKPLAAAGLERVNKADGASGRMEELIQAPVLFMLEYSDGLRGALLQPASYGAAVRGWAYAAQADGNLVATGLRSHGVPYPHFSYLGLNVQRMFVTGQPQYPVERTLLVSGVLDALMESRRRGHVRLETPHLAISYAPAATRPIRPTGPRPVGASTEPLD